MTGGSEGGEVPGRSLEVEGEAWAVSEEGGGRSGTWSDIGASLLLVRFSSNNPDRPVREVLIPAVSLDGLGDDTLLEAFHRSRPRRSVPSQQDNTRALAEQPGADDVSLGDNEVDASAAEVGEAEEDTVDELPVSD